MARSQSDHSLAASLEAGDRAPTNNHCNSALSQPSVRMPASCNVVASPALGRNRTAPAHRNLATQQTKRTTQTSLL